MLYREWLLRQAEDGAAQQLAQATGEGELLCRVLAGRGIDTPDAAHEMLCEDGCLPDAMAMKDMDRAVRRIAQAVEDDELMVVFGDYDVDGITATALLYTYLAESMGANVFYKLPSRNDDDYGLSPHLVDDMAQRGISLIITVDNGTTAFEALERAAEQGVSVVVTDHHLPQEQLPAVDALVNPHRADDNSGLDCLSGVGVAFMLVAALEGCTPEEMLPLFGDLAAIGTVADVMKLTGPNRLLVRAGLAALQDTQRPGLQALIDACGWRDKGVTAENISYGLAPRLNAAGRMDDATTALRLLLAEDEDEAKALVEGLQQQNAARQKAEQEILEIIDAQMQQDPELARARVLVIWGDGWHQGVIGIVASRLVDRYARPAMVISFDGEDGKGSGRSFGGFSLHGAVQSCEDILLRFGGHDLAAGFSLKKEHVKQFRKRVNKWAAEHNPVPVLPAIWADAEVSAAQLSLAAVQQLERLAPCGSGNPQPQLLLQNARLEAVYPVSEGRHSRLRLRQNGSVLYAVLFGTGPAALAYRAGDVLDVMVVLSIYEGKAGAQVSARVVDLRPAGLDNAHVAGAALFEGVLGGAVPAAGQVDGLLPTREDTAEVYRQIKAGGVSAGDLRPLFANSQAPAGRLLTALATLEELGLVAQNDDGWYQAVPVKGKKDLAQGRLMQRLAQYA